MWEYIGTVGLLSLGIASFPLLAFHAQTQDLLTSAQIPLVFALARGLGLLLAGVVMGLAYDQSITLVVWLIVWINAVALTALTWVLARIRARRL